MIISLQFLTLQNLEDYQLLFTLNTTAQYLTTIVLLTDDGKVYSGFIEGKSVKNRTALPKGTNIRSYIVCSVAN